MRQELVQRGFVWEKRRPRYAKDSREEKELTICDCAALRFDISNDVTGDRNVHFTKLIRQLVLSPTVFLTALPNHQTS